MALATSPVRAVATLVEALLHVRLILRMKEIETALCEQLLRCVGQHVTHALVYKRELAVHRVAGDKLCNKTGLADKIIH